MSKMILNIDVPKDLVVDVNRLTSIATDYLQNYVYMLSKTQKENNGKAKSTKKFRNLRGAISSDRSYPEMLEEALLEKYEV